MQWICELFMINQVVCNLANSARSRQQLCCCSHDKCVLYFIPSKQVKAGGHSSLDGSRAVAMLLWLNETYRVKLEYMSGILVLLKMLG